MSMLNFGRKILRQLRGKQGCRFRLCQEITLGLAVAASLAALTLQKPNARAADVPTASTSVSSQNADVGEITTAQIGKR